MPNATAPPADRAAALSYVELVASLRHTLNSHPAGAGIQLVITPARLAMAPDEVLVQEVSGDCREVRLVVRRIEDLSPDDVVQESQIVNLHAEDLAAEMPKCLIRYPDGPNNPRHFHN